LNRKLIRPKLTEIAIRPVEESRSASHPPKPPVKNGHERGGQPRNNPGHGKPPPQSAQKKSPPQDTNAEIFYYKKQIEGHVPMVIILQDGEKILGTIEWYDRHALKVNRENEPNIVLLKHNIKYMYKDPERT
jgi:sRNA-binding regulator protein Hfq